jgi:DNA-directed RNA polymerase subunit RPC12/RpoP
MATQHFLKGACGSCGGHLEFPVEGAGQDITCPHCGQRTKLLPLRQPAPSISGKRMLVLGVMLAGLVALSARLWLASREKPAPVAVAATNHIANLTAPLAPVTTAPVTSATSVVAPPAPAPSQLQPGETLTNDFIITAGHLEPTPGSSLVYVTGKVRNPTDRQRFGVKVRFALLDASGAIIGSATDYQSVIDPQGEWSFKAMVMESKTVAAQLGGISEDK